MNTNSLEQNIGKKMTRKKRSRFFDIYISKVLKKILPDNGLTSNAKQQLNSAICIIAKNLSNTSEKLAKLYKRRTMTLIELNISLQLTFPDSFVQEVNDKFDESMEKYESTDLKNRPRHEKANLIFSVSKTEQFLRNFDYSKIKISHEMPIFLACILELFTEQILMHSGLRCNTGGRARITIKDLQMTVYKDDIMSQIFKNHNINFLGGGVEPYIHSALQNKKPRKKPKKNRKKKNRFRYGTLSLRKIKKYQKINNCLFFPRAPFKRIVKKIMDNTKEDVKVSKHVMIMLQYYIEQFLIEFLQHANLIAIHTGRTVIHSEDLQLVSKIRDYPECDIMPFLEKQMAKDQKKIKDKENLENENNETNENNEKDV